MPSSPGMSMVWPPACGVAQSNVEGTTLATSAAPDICFRKSRLEFISLTPRARILLENRNFAVTRLAPPGRKSRVAKTGPAAILKGRRPSEGVDEVDLLALERRLLGACGANCLC